MLEINQSEMKVWLECRRRWYYDFILRPERSEPMHGHLALGTNVHKSLHDYYKVGVTPPSVVAGLSAHYDRLMLENPVEAADIADDRDIAIPVVKGYFEWLAEEGADAGTETLAVEETLTAPLGEGWDEITLHGTIDRVYRRHNGLIVIQDHKTVSQFDAADALQIDFQGLTYALLYKMNNPDARAVFEYNMLKKNKRSARAKPPFYQRVEVRYSDEQLRNHWRHLTVIAKEIELARSELRAQMSHHEIAPPTPGSYCSWKCSLGLSGCALMDDAGGTEFIESLVAAPEKV